MAQNNWWSNKWGNIQPVFSEVKSLWKGFEKIWKDSEITFGQADFTWGEIAVVQEVAQVIRGGRGDSLGNVYDWQQWQQQNQKKKRQVIKLLARIKGEKFEEQKDYKDIKIKVSDARLVVETVLKTKVNVLNESIKLSGENKWHINSIQIKMKNSSVL